MPNEIAKAEDIGSEVGRMFASLVELARDPDVDPQKITALVGAQRSMLEDMREQDFQTAMAKTRAAMPTITKDGKITNKNGDVQSRYAHFEAIDKIARPIAEANGLTYGFNVQGSPDGKVLVTCEVTHTGTHGSVTKQFGPMPLAVDTTGAKNATQGAGSALSYGRRHTLCAAFNIITAGEDNDGGPRKFAEIPGLNPAELLDAAQVAATKGSESYATWFKSRSNMERGWLMDGGHHARLKDGAAECD
jgi:hypothetical protein